MSEPDGINIAEEVARLTGEGRPPAARHLRQADALAEDAGRAPSGPAEGHATTSAALITDFTPLAGDRAFADDRGGARRARPVPRPLGGGAGHREGRRHRKPRVTHNFGMARPEGYRKARRLIELAGRFGLPVLTLRRHLRRLSRHRGRGARPGRGDRALDRGLPRSAGAAGRHHHRRGRLGRRDRAGRRRPGADAGARDLFGDLAGGLRLDPVARRRRRRPTAAEALRLTAEDLLRLSVIDQIIPEPLGGAHRDPAATLRARRCDRDALAPLLTLDGPTLIARRQEKFLEMGRDALAG